MNYLSFCKDFLSWNENGRGLFDFGGGRVLWSSPLFFVIEPAEDPRCVVKIVRNRIKSVKREFQKVRKIESLGLLSPAYVLPVALDYHLSTAFDYIVLSNVGPDYSLASIKQNFARKAGHTVGLFAAQLLDKAGSVHNDIYWKNLTAAGDGKIGIIDLDSVVPFGKRMPLEKMFYRPLMLCGNLAGHMAVGFLHNVLQMGYHVQLDLNKLRMFSRQMNSPSRWGWEKNDPRTAELNAEMDTNLKTLQRTVQQSGLGRAIVPLSL